MKWTIGRALASAVIGVIGLSGPAAAQEMWLGPTHGGSLALEVQHVRFTDWGMEDIGYYATVKQSLGSVAMFLTARLPVWQRTSLVIELPVANGRFTVDDGFGDRATVSDFAIGNPYIGVEGGQGGGNWFGEFGVRAPIMSETKVASALVGISSDLDRMEAFAPDVASVSAFGNFRSGGETGLRLRIRVGPLVDIPTKSGMGHAEAYAVYGVQAGVASRLVEIAGGLTGRMILTEEADNRLTDQFVASLHLNLGRVEPGVDIRVPIDNELKQLVGSVFGLSVRYAF